MYFYSKSRVISSTVVNIIRSGLEEMKEELKGFAESGDEVLESILKGYADNEDEVLENRIHHWVWEHTQVTLRGSNAGPDRGNVYYQGRPLCSEDKDTHNVWDISDANVICRMLGYTKATNAPHDSCDFGDCPPAGIPFSMSGFKCTGSETHITDCPHDPTVSSRCGSNGVTDGSAVDIVGVECA